MPLAELYPWVDNNDQNEDEIAAYDRMTHELCRGMGLEEAEEKEDKVFAILAQDKSAASLTAKLDEAMPHSINIVTQIPTPSEVGLKQHICLVMHARVHVGGLIVAAGKTDRLLDTDVG